MENKNHLIGSVTDNSETLFGSLHSEYQNLVREYYEPVEWDDFTPPFRLKMINWLISAHRDEQAAVEEIKGRQAYWFELQTEILEILEKISELRMSPRTEAFAELLSSPKASLALQLAAAQQRWHCPDALAAQQQLTAEKLVKATTIVMLDLAAAIEFLNENTGVTWGEPQVLSLISNAEISLYAVVAPWAQIAKQEIVDSGIRERPFLRPGRDFFVKLSPQQVHEVWVNGETCLPARTYIEELPPSGDGSLVLNSSITVQRVDIRMTMEIVLRTLKKWESSRQPLAPGLAPPYFELAALPATRPAHVSTHKMRANSLDSVIEKAIQQSPNRDTASVWLELRELALTGERPFTGEIVGKALCYTNDENEPDEFTRNALAGRLRRRK